MPRITFIEFSGACHEVQAQSGLFVMEAAVKNGVPGIEAECGGACACATCHVFVDPAWLGQVGKPDSTEAAMLEFVDGLADNSRLSCQIKITDALDGLVVRLPESQR